MSNLLVFLLVENKTRVINTKFYSCKNKPIKSNIWQQQRMKKN